MSAIHHHNNGTLDGKEYESRSDSIGRGREYGDGNGAPLSQTMTLSAEQFEKLYLSPKTEVAGDLRKTFGNPSAMAVMGFSVALLPLSISFIGFRGSGGGGVATTCASIWFGGVLLIIAGFLEFILGNTFPFVVFMGFGAHFLTLATTSIPWFGVQLNIDPTGKTPMPFDASFGFYTLAMALLSFCFLICSIRTNVAFLLVFIGATLGFCLATGSYWALANGNAPLAITLLKGTGGSFFAADLVGWYLLLSILMASVDLPAVPLFDLSIHVKGVSERAAAKQMHHTE